MFIDFLVVSFSYSRIFPTSLKFHRQTEFFFFFIASKVSRVKGDAFAWSRSFVFRDVITMHGMDLCLPFDVTSFYCWTVLEFLWFKVELPATMHVPRFIIDGSPDSWNLTNYNTNTMESISSLSSSISSIVKFFFHSMKHWIFHKQHVYRIYSIVFERKIINWFLRDEVLVCICVCVRVCVFDIPSINSSYNFFNNLHNLKKLEKTMFNLRCVIKNRCASYFADWFHRIFRSRSSHDGSRLASYN